MNKLAICQAFPMSLRKEVISVINLLSAENLEVHPNAKQHIILEGEKLIIPRRIYFDEPKQILENQLSPTQQTILNCIYLSHHNGFVRQAKLEKFNSNHDYFVTPFVFQLLGEYVVEILEVMYLQLTDHQLKNFARFVDENPKYWLQTESRIISYWNEYYRHRYPRLKDYIGYQLLQKIKEQQT